MGKRILIVDDSSMMRKMITKTLTDHGHRVIGEAKNGCEAVQLYKALKPDLVTMDITMREMDGLSAAREILNDDTDAQIIFVSNLDEEKYEENVARIGAIGYVSKNEARKLLDLISTYSDHNSI
jgi:two-component system, chemotaxis family, chemotaxis protein CheY